MVFLNYFKNLLLKGIIYLLSDNDQNNITLTNN